MKVHKHSAAVVRSGAGDIDQRKPTRQSARRHRDAAEAADRALERAQAVWRLGDLERATQHIEEALAILEEAGLWNRLGTAYKLHAMAFISRDQASLALAAATRALGYPDVGARDRMYLYGTIAMALHQLVDLPAGGKVMIEQAWPEALKAGDAKTIVDCASRCAGLMHDLACWALGIPNLSLLVLDTPPPEPAAFYIDQARRFIEACEPHLAALEPLDRSWFYCQKGCVVALADGFDAAWPVFMNARDCARGFPRQAMMTEKIIGTSARLCGRPETSLEHLLRARAMESAQSEQSRRLIAWELSQVYALLGKPELALAELRVFDVLQARKSKLSIEWIGDAANRRRYGGRLNLRAAQDALASAQPPAAVARARLHIESHLHQRLSLDQVARAAHVSKRTLQNLFHDHLGVAVGRFIRERRLQRADEELRSGMQRIAEVAERAGYSNPANFSRDYRQRFGRSPSSTHRLVHGLARRPAEDRDPAP
jgi:AraC-like DNA-binding protein